MDEARDYVDGFAIRIIKKAVKKNYYRESAVIPIDKTNFFFKYDGT